MAPGERSIKMEQIDIVRRAIERNIRWMLGLAVVASTCIAFLVLDGYDFQDSSVLLILTGILGSVVFLENLVGFVCNCLKFKQELVRPGSTEEKAAYEWAKELILVEAWDAAQERASTWRLGKLVTRAEFLGNLEKYFLKESNLKDPSLISSC